MPRPFPRLRPALLLVALCLAALSLLAAPRPASAAPPTTLTYTGQLLVSGSPVSGLYDFQFSLWTAPTGGTQVGATVSVPSVNVQSGVFYAEINFGNAIAGQALYLQTAYSPAGAGTYTTQTPRKLVPTSSYADYAANAGYAASAGLAGTANNTTALQGKPLSKTAPTTGQVLTFSGTQWTPAAGMPGPQGAAGPQGVAGPQGAPGVAGPTYSSGTGLALSGTTFSVAPNAIDHTLLASDGASLSQVSGGQLTTDATHLIIEHDFIIKGTGIGITGHGGGAGNNGGAGRAVVDGGPVAGLVINYANDFGLVTIGSNLAVTGTDFRLVGRGGGVGNGGGVGRALVDLGNNGGLSINYQNDFGQVNIGSDTTVEGNLGVTSNISCVTMNANSLQLNGGSDLAEPYKIAPAAQVQPRPGLVVSIDPAHTGQMRVSTRAYDATVGGILSGANGVQPGITLRQAGTVADGSLPLASAGRVWCWCDADAGGAISPGDLLTTSDTPGHAMRAADHARAQGAIIGKAMSPLKTGKGLVLVLVSLE